MLQWVSTTLQESGLTKYGSIPALAFLAALAGLSQTHPAVKPVSATKTTPTAARKKSDSPAKPALTDAELEKTIRAKLAKSKISADKFEMHVKGGVAIFEGSTDVLQHKGVATRMANTAGAKQVDNRIQVSQKAKDQAAGNLTKGRRRAQVKRGEPERSRSDRP